MKLTRKVAIVTGGSRGIGNAIVRTFAREGASVAVSYISSADQSKEVVEQITVNGGKAMAVRADVSDRHQVKEMISEVVLAYGRVDILVNNAGIIIGGTTLGTKEEDWDREMAVNLKGPFHCTQECARIMVQQKYGKIINVSSISGLGGAPQGELAYCCAKAGLIALTMVAAQELGPYGINVNCIAPGWTRTDMTLQEAKGRIEEVENLKASMAAVRRIGEPEDIANAALFLASDESSFVTGQVIVADGGRRDFLSHA